VPRTATWNKLLSFLRAESPIWNPQSAQGASDHAPAGAHAQASPRGHRGKGGGGRRPRRRCLPGRLPQPFGSPNAHRVAAGKASARAEDGHARRANCRCRSGTPCRSPADGTSHAGGQLSGLAIAKNGRCGEVGPQSSERGEAAERAGDGPGEGREAAVTRRKQRCAPGGRRRLGGARAGSACQQEGRS